MIATFFAILAQVATFGSFASSQRFLDPKSPVKPTSMLTAPGELRGRWRSGSRANLLIVNVAPSAEERNAEPGYYGFTEDFFSVTLGDVQPMQIHATYGSFVAYAMDADGDGRDELFVEYGEGRGTSVYVRQLGVYIVVGDRWRPLLDDLALNGYLRGSSNSDDYDPLTWARSYSLLRKDGRIAIRLTLTSPQELPKFIDPTADVEALQFPKLQYEFNPKRQTYEIANFVFRRLP